MTMKFFTSPSPTGLEYVTRTGLVLQTSELLFCASHISRPSWSFSHWTLTHCFEDCKQRTKRQMIHKLYTFKSILKVHQTLKSQSFDEFSMKLRKSEWQILLHTWGIYWCSSHNQTKFSFWVYYDNNDIHNSSDPWIIFSTIVKCY